MEGLNATIRKGVRDSDGWFNHKHLQVSLELVPMAKVLVPMAKVFDH